MSDVAEYVLDVSRWMLVAVFAVAAAAKLTRRDGVASLAATLRRGFGLSIAGLAAWPMVAAEAAVAVLLAVPATVAAGAVAATTMTSALTVGAAVLARRAAAVPCRCFGGASSRVTWVTVGRNGALTMMVVVVLVAYRSGRGLAPPSVSLAAAATALVALLLIRCLMIAASQPRRRTGDGDGRAAVLPPNGPDVGGVAPAITDAVTAGVAGNPRLVVFLSASCQGCRTALPRLTAYIERSGGRADVVVAIVGDPAVAADITEVLDERAQLVAGEPAAALAEAYRIALFPTHVRLGTDGVVEAVTLSVDELPRPVG